MLAEKSAKYADKPAAFLADLMRDWDPNRDGSITKMEFRHNIKKLLPNDKRLDTKEIDTLFDALDEDKGGELDSAELRLALKKLQDIATSAAIDVASIQANSERLEQRAALVKELAETVRVYETKEADIAQLIINGTSTGARLGSVLKQKGLKVADVVAKWGGSDGLIEKEEFRRELLALGLHAGHADMDALFDSLDGDGGGALDSSEVKAALKRFADEAETMGTTLKKLKEDVRTIYAVAAKEATRRYKDLVAEEEAQAAEEMARAAQEAQRKAAKAAEAKAARETKAAEKAAAAAMEKAALEAKIVAKRMLSA